MDPFRFQNEKGCLRSVLLCNLNCFGHQTAPPTLKVAADAILGMVLPADLPFLYSIMCDLRVRGSYEPGRNVGISRLAWDTFEEDAVRLKLTKHDNAGVSSIIGGAEILEGYISYFIDPSFWGNGYGTSLVKGICVFADRMNLQVLHARTLRSNLVSIKILQKHGFSFSGLSRIETRLGRQAILSFNRDSRLQSR